MENGFRVWGGTYHLFKDIKGNKFCFKGIKQIWPGDIYEMNSDETMKIRPQSCESQDNWEFSLSDKNEYEAQKEIVKYQRLERKKKMELKRPHQDIVTAIALLKPFFKNLNFMDSERFLNYLRNETSKRGKRD